MYKVVLVDDEYEIRYGLTNYFPWEKLGFEVSFECQNGQEALEVLLNNKVDVLFSDICMPKMNGIDLAEEVVKRGLPIKIIFLSAHRDFDYAKKAINVGVFDYIVKPSKYDELYSVFSSLKEELDKQFSKIDTSEVENNKKLTYSDNIIITIQDYVLNHFNTVTLDEVAEIIHMSANYVSTYYKEKTGQNFSDLVHTIKMEKAEELLLDPKYKTYEVSSLIGYSNPKNFTRMFKKYYGKSPREFRNETRSYER